MLYINDKFANFTCHINFNNDGIKSSYKLMMGGYINEQEEREEKQGVEDA